MAEWRPQLVGISANTPVYPTAAGTGRAWSKQACPGGHRGAGRLPPDALSRNGPWPTRPSMPSWWARANMAMAEIAAALAAGRDLSGIAGVVHRRDGRVVREAERPFLDDLDRLPPPAFDLLPIRRYRISLGMARGTPAVSMVASRGCPMNCKFCTSPGIWKRRWRHHSPALRRRRAGDARPAARRPPRPVSRRHLHHRPPVGRGHVRRDSLRRGLRLTWDCYSTVGLVREDMVRRDEGGRLHLPFRRHRVGQRRDAAEVQGDVEGARSAR